MHSMSNLVTQIGLRSAVMSAYDNLGIDDRMRKGMCVLLDFICVYFRVEFVFVFALCDANDRVISAALAPIGVELNKKATNQMCGEYR